MSVFNWGQPKHENEIETQMRNPVEVPQLTPAEEAWLRDMKQEQYARLLSDAEDLIRRHLKGTVGDPAAMACEAVERVFEKAAEYAGSHPEKFFKSGRAKAAAGNASIYRWLREYLCRVLGVTEGTGIGSRVVKRLKTFVFGQETPADESDEAALTSAEEAWILAVRKIHYANVLKRALELVNVFKKVELPDPEGVALEGTEKAFERAAAYAMLNSERYFENDRPKIPAEDPHIYNWIITNLRYVLGGSLDRTGKGTESCGQGSHGVEPQREHGAWPGRV